jgi:hypothetical protein
MTNSKVCECPGCASGTHVALGEKCIARNSDAPHLWQRLMTALGRELFLCPGCLKERVSRKEFGGVI